MIYPTNSGIGRMTLNLFLITTHHHTHERYKDRIASGEQTERHHTVDEYPADICNIAGIKTPDCKINIENLNN